MRTRACHQGDPSRVSGHLGVGSLSAAAAREPAFTQHRREPNDTGPKKKKIGPTTNLVDGTTPRLGWRTRATVPNYVECE